MPRYQSVGDATRPKIHHDPEVEPAFVSAHVRDVSRPGLIALTDKEASIQLIVREGQLVRSHCGPAKALRKRGLRALSAD